MVGAGLLRAGAQPAPRGGARSSREHGGAIPASEAALRALPGIGPYTAAAVAAIAFDARGVRARRQHDAGARPAGGRAPAGRRARDARGAARARPGRGPAAARGRLQPGDDGAGRAGLHAAQPALRRLSAGGRLPRARRRPGGVVAAQAAARGAPDRARRLRVHHRRRARAGRQARQGAACGDLGAARGDRFRGARARPAVARRLAEATGVRVAGVPTGAPSATCSRTGTSPPSCFGSTSRPPARAPARPTRIAGCRPAGSRPSAFRASRARPSDSASARTIENVENRAESVKAKTGQRPVSAVVKERW